jgi:ribA/ribD-fused uncharacterized protein
MFKISEFQAQYRFLSNFWPAPVVYQEVEYPTVEHAYQAAKSLCLVKRLEISKMKTPGDAKRAGKYVELRQDWDQVKDEIMENLVRLKFQIPSLSVLLLQTGNAELIEGNTWGDTYWGRCNGVGKNKLGVILMKIRDEIRCNRLSE